MSAHGEAATAYRALLGAAAKVRKTMDQRLREQFGMSSARFDLLAALDMAGRSGLRAGALTAQLGATDGNTTQLAAPLVREGLIERLPDPSDGRAAIFRITRKGKAQFARVAEEHRRYIVKLFEDVGGKDLNALAFLLHKLNLPVEEPEAEEDAA